MASSSRNAIARRQMLTDGSAGLAAALLLFVRRAGAKWRKSTKKEAGYVEHDRPLAQMCVQCTFFLSPHDCVLVEGPISPQGWCNFYED